MVKKFEPIDDTTFKVGHGKHGKSVVGNKDKKNKFEPQVFLDKWNEECFLKGKWLKGKGKKSWEKETDSEGNITKLKWVEDAFEVHFYSRDKEQKISWEYTDEEGTKTQEMTQYDDGALEFKVILKSRPPKNSITLPIETQNLDFFYQPELHPDHPTWEDSNGDGVADGFRPPNVVGSYAVYHSEKGNVHPEGEAEKYKTGKAFHIYRPHLIDDVGNETYADLEIDEKRGELTITVDQSWLKNASYPVRVDPTFGYETAGGSTQRIAQTPPSSNQVGTAFETTSGWNVTDLTAHIRNTQETGFYAGLYEEDGAGADSHSLYDYVQETGTTSDWTTWSVSATISSGYTILILRGNADWSTSEVLCDIAYDSVGTLRWYDESGLGTSPGAPPDPWSQAEAGTGRKYSIYATYTAPGPPENTICVEKSTGKLTLNTAYTPLRHDPSNGKIGTSSDLPNYLILDPPTGEINSQAA